MNMNEGDRFDPLEGGDFHPREAGDKREDFQPLSSTGEDDTDGVGDKEYRGFSPYELACGYEVGPRETLQDAYISSIGNVESYSANRLIEFIAVDTYLRDSLQEFFQDRGFLCDSTRIGSWFESIEHKVDELISEGIIDTYICLADGMGGGANGDVAGGLVTYLVTADILWTLQQGEALHPNAAVQALKKANRFFVEHAQSLAEPTKSSGTTCVVGIGKEGTHSIASVGDSRVYHLSYDANQATELTLDRKSKAWKKLERYPTNIREVVAKTPDLLPTYKDVVNPFLVRKSTLSSVISTSPIVYAKGIDIVTNTVSLKPGETLVFVTDGADPLNEEKDPIKPEQYTIDYILAHSSSLVEACHTYIRRHVRQYMMKGNQLKSPIQIVERLIKRSHQTRDNATAIVLRKK